MVPVLPDRAPFALRARILTPIAEGGTRYVPDGVLLVDRAGRIAWLGPWDEWQARGGRVGPDALLARAKAGSPVPEGLPGTLRPLRASEPDVRPFGLPAPPKPPVLSGPEIRPIAEPIDLRPWLVLPGLVDLHAHLPQLPNAGLGAGLGLLQWLERYIFPLEQGFDEQVAERLAPAAFRAFAAAGTTTAVLYSAVYAESTDAAFRAAEAHGIRAVIGKVMMDRLTYDPAGRSAGETLELSLRQSSDLCSRWHGRDGGRLRYAFTPRFAVSCSAEMLRESAALAAASGAYWQTHIAEDRDELEEVGRLFPEAIDYLDVYDRAGALGERAILAHGIHLSEREIGRIVGTGTRLVHCPASNLFLASGVMPLARYLAAGVVVGLGSDVSGGPDLQLFAQMRVGAYTQTALRVARGEELPVLDPAGWLRLATYDGARVLGLESVVGSLEPGKDADLIAVDPSLTEPLPGTSVDEPDELLSRLVYRSHPAMVRGAWVRGRRLDGPA